MRTLARPLALALAFVSLPGCFWFTTKDEGNALKKRVVVLEDRTGKSEDELQSKLAKLDEALDKATKLLTRNNADIGSQVDELRGGQAALTGQIEDLKRQNEALKTQVATMSNENADLTKKIAEYEARIAALEAKAGIGKPGTTPVAEIGKDDLYKRAQTALDAGQLADARRDFRDFVKRFPQDGKADDAQYAVGETYMKEKAFDKALGEFQKVIDAYENGDMVDKALFRAGDAAVELKWCVDARAYYGLLVQKYPKSALVKDANKKLDFIKKNAKKKDICQS